MNVDSHKLFWQAQAMLTLGSQNQNSGSSFQKSELFQSLIQQASGSINKNQLGSVGDLISRST